MYADPIEMDCYLYLICTSNSRTPVLIGKDDRRTELVVINEELKLYAELDDTKIAVDCFGHLFTLLVFYFCVHINVNWEF